MEEENEFIEDHVTWFDYEHKFNETMYLTKNDPRYNNPPGFKGTLFPPQATLLYAMHRLEGEPFIMGEGGLTMQIKMARLAEKFSFGKTVLSIALICASKSPTIMPDFIPNLSSTHHIMKKSVKDNHYATYGTRQRHGYSMSPKVSVIYAEYLPLTVVAVSANVIPQWEREITRFTDLKYYTINDANSFRKFYTIFKKNKASEYDIIILKVGSITGNFTLDGEVKNEGEKAANKKRSIIDTFNIMLDGYAVSRLMIDDFDTLQLTFADCFIPAAFTWLISSTFRNTCLPKWRTVNSFSSVAELVSSYLPNNTPIKSASNDDVLETCLSLRCDPEYVDEFINSTHVRFKNYFIPGGNVTKILADLRVRPDLLEMINAGAVGTAARELGIDTNSVTEVAQNLIGQHMDIIRQSKKTIKRIEMIREKIHNNNNKNAVSIPIGHTQIKKYTDSEFADFIQHLNGTTNSTIENLLDEIKNEAQSNYAEYTKSYDRMRSNLKSESCPCCFVPLKEQNNVFVMSNCCQLIICEFCMVHSNRCPNCLNSNKAIRINCTLNYDNLIDTLDTDMPPPIDDKQEAAFDRADSLISFISKQLIDTNVIVKCMDENNKYHLIQKLLDGKKDIPWPEDKQKKILIFTMYTESTHSIKEKLQQHRIKYCQLAGTKSQRDEAVQLLKTSPDVHVILVTSPKDCAGINFPFISHIVLYHVIIDPHVESQIIARGQRLGREYNLEVVSFLNKEEMVKKTLYELPP